MRVQCTPLSVATASADTVARRAAAFRARLGRSGIDVAPDIVDDLVPSVSRAYGREFVLQAARTVSAHLTAGGNPCSRSQALEAIAAYHGERSWAAMDAALRKSVGTSSFTVVEQDDVLGDLVLLQPADDGVARWDYMHPDDCRPSARRISLWLGNGSDDGTARVSEGIGRTHAVLAEVVVPAGGRKALTWEANLLASEWMAECPSSNEEASRSERTAACVLARAGFGVVHSGGGVFLWMSNRDGLTFCIGAAEGEDAVKVRTDEPVLLSIESDATGEETSSRTTLDGALESIAAVQSSEPGMEGLAP